LRTHDLEEALAQLELDLELYIADRAPRRTFVHAGVVGWNGQAIVIPGRSFSGKSSLVKALVEAGASYYSDEFAVLDERGRVHPYPIPLTIRPARDGGPPMKYRAEELGGVAGIGPLPVGLVLITRYVSGTRFRPRPLSVGRAVLELLAHTLPARRRPGRVLDALSRVVSQALVLRLSGGRRRDRITMRAVLQLGRVSDGVDPGAEPVTISLRDADGPLWSTTVPARRLTRRRGTFVLKASRRSPLRSLRVDKERRGGVLVAATSGALDLTQGGVRTLTPPFTVGVEVGDDSGMANAVPRVVRARGRRGA